MKYYTLMFTLPMVRQMPQTFCDQLLKKPGISRLVDVKHTFVVSEHEREFLITNSKESTMMRSMLVRAITGGYLPEDQMLEIKIAEGGMPILHTGGLAKGPDKKTQEKK